MRKILIFLPAIIILSCKTKDSEKVVPEGTYRYDVQFLKTYEPGIIQLSDESGRSKLIISPAWQGRVMTSTAEGDDGRGFGWINHQLIKDGEKKKQFNPAGGEERLWLGPEGGQFSLYFPAGAPFNIASWQVPALLDTIAFDVAAYDSTEAVLTKDATLTNYAGTVFELSIERKITLLDPEEIESLVDTELPESVNSVGYRTSNKIENIGDEEWKKETGLISVWLLGMMNPSDQTVAILPFIPVAGAKEKISTDYFGEIPAERLSIQDSVALFTCDGRYRSKIGLHPTIAKSVAGSFDFQQGALTLIFFSVERERPYVNSQWEMQQDPYDGDAVNSYNDGPLADGTQLGPFYELESSSPAMALAAGGHSTYEQVTLHLTGDFTVLQTIAQKVLGVDLSQIRKTTP